ncbi:DUF5709 domain-containing protein [Streptomyces narbonensis]|uniref:DUF5709 domain-containing protein n=1 Tax=Streptomyces narbonensis TaxID=67333 RepID=UPI00198A44C0|nr:DUF5709 domain-containing protein [Streptomyces narbonensis]GGW03438.1 hypothetical protein GCM10010230_38620 [Streptomyces narbonensis]
MPDRDASNASDPTGGSDRMADEARGDDVYQPTRVDTADRPTEHPDPDNSLMTDPLDDPSGSGYSPPERPRGVTRHGTTRREQQEGEPLDERLAQEEPDPPEQPPAGDGIGDLPGGQGEPVDEQAGATRAGRLAPVRSRPGHVDHAVARDVGPDDGAAPAEEAAMHVDTGADENAEPSAAPEDEPG